MKRILAVCLIICVIALSYPPDSEAIGLFQGLFRKLFGTASPNPGTTGGGVVAPAGPTYGVGNLLTERFTAIGTWAETVEGGGDTLWNQTTVSGNGFETHMTAVGTTDWQANISKDIGAQSAVYFRFFYYLTSESWADGIAENIFTLAANGGTINNTSYMRVFLRQVATNDLQLFVDVLDGTAATSGSDHHHISTGTIYIVTGKVTDDGATGTAEWNVYDEHGSLLVTGLWAEKAALGTVAIQDIFIGQSYTSTAASHSFGTLDISSTGYLTDSGL